MGLLAQVVWFIRFWTGSQFRCMAVFGIWFTSSALGVACACAACACWFVFPPASESAGSNCVLCGVTVMSHKLEAENRYFKVKCKS